jgi:hypothetical protein
VTLPRVLSHFPVLSRVAMQVLVPCRCVFGGRSASECW